jgi:hypothetical protein
VCVCVCFCGLESFVIDGTRRLLSKEKIAGCGATVKETMRRRRSSWRSDTCVNACVSEE